MIEPVKIQQTIVVPSSLLAMPTLSSELVLLLVNWLASQRE